MPSTLPAGDGDEVMEKRSDSGSKKAENDNLKSEVKSEESSTPSGSPASSNTNTSAVKGKTTSTPKKRGKKNGTKRKRKVVEEGKPKGKCSSYMFFTKEVRESVVREHPELTLGTGRSRMRLALC